MVQSLVRERHKNFTTLQRSSSWISVASYHFKSSRDGDDQSDSNNSMHQDDQQEEDGKESVAGAEAATYDHRTGTKPKQPPTGHEIDVRPKQSRVPPLERFLFALHPYIMGIPSTTPQHSLEAARRLLKKGVAVPYSLPLPTEETNWKVAFDPPTDIILVGSWANKVSVKPKDDLKLGVDLAIEMSDLVSREGLSQRSFFPQAFLLSRHHCCSYSKSRVRTRCRRLV